MAKTTPRKKKVTEKPVKTTPRKKKATEKPVTKVTPCKKTCVIRETNQTFSSQED